MIDTAQAAWIDAHVERTGDVTRTHAAVGDGAPGADGGPSLGERKEGEDAFIAALVEYGRLQRRLEGCVEEMLALGVADMRPAVMPDRFHEALAAAGSPAEVAALEPVEHPRRPALPPCSSRSA